VSIDIKTATTTGTNHSER